MAAVNAESVRFVGFNQDCSCLAVGTSKGYRIFTTDEPVRKCYEKMCGGMGIVCMLYRTSLLALVGAGCSQQSPRQLQLHNTHENTNICNISFADTVLAVKLNKKRLVVILERCLHIFDVTKMAALQIIDTEKNEKGLGALSMADDHSVVAYPKAAEPGCGDVMVADAITAQNAHLVRAHRSPLAAISLSACGTKLATASDKGTVIRVFRVSLDGRSEAPLLYTLRRGSNRTTIYSVAFNDAASLLAVSSATGTVHIFRCAGEGQLSDAQKAATHRPGTVSHTVQDMYTAERSWAKAQVRDSSQPNCVALSRDSRRVMVATRDGRLYAYALDLAQGGQCRLEAEHLLTAE